MSVRKNDRPSLGFSEELDALDANEFISSTKILRPARETTQKAAEAAGFRSREHREQVPTSKPLQRRRRTGRNAQFNIKAKPETIETFTKIADANGWGLGETFELATTLLAREYLSR